ncbi:MAG TPA: trypsin-like peptidase domain-containing protein, partial [Gaiellaceae bacterium]|nr:trypsin-like peptidase domain-containing protein [Gaiellaceae bacterium]
RYNAVGMPRRSPLLALSALLGTGVLGGAVALLGASAVGIGRTTTTVEQLGAAVQGSPASFDRSRGGSNGGALSINEIFRRDAPGVVQVTSTTVVAADPFFGGSQEQEALGSGFVIDKAGHIVTNFHVVANAKSVEVSFSNSDNMKARIVGADPSTDIAVLQVDARSRALTPLPFGNSDRVHVGDSVVAIGNPLGYDRSVTAGIVSALQRAITAPNQYPIDHVIQTDAPINHGNSGGPLIDARGDVIGVNAQIATGNSATDGNIGIGFAIPINTVRTVAAQLIKKGKVEHAFIGITAKSVTPEIARLFRLPAKHGLLVVSVEPGSGAAAAGLRAGTETAVVSGESWPVGGDLIVAADGRKLTDIDQLRDLVALKKPGQSLLLQIYRGNAKKTLTVKLGRQPASPPG